jgi:hypothetical protein
LREVGLRLRMGGQVGMYRVLMRGRTFHSCICRQAHGTRLCVAEVSVETVTWQNVKNLVNRVSYFPSEFQRVTEPLQRFDDLSRISSSPYLHVTNISKSSTSSYHGCSDSSLLNRWDSLLSFGLLQPPSSR